MAGREVSRSFRSAFGACSKQPRPQAKLTLRRIPARPCRRISTTAVLRAEVTDEEIQEKFQAAPPLEFDGEGGERTSNESASLGLRVVPVSPSYFTAKPNYTDDFIALSALLRKVATLPVIPNAEAPRVAWKTVEQYRILTNEYVNTGRYHRMVQMLKRLNCVHPSLMPDEVQQAMLRYKKESQPGDVKPKPQIIDEEGRAKGVGRRKASSAVAWLVEGEGEVLVNGKSLSQFFGRLHHRESAVWALKATQRLDKYNVFALVPGGGLTGQAEAITLAVAKALLVHEPALKGLVRRAGCITRDPRRVERKKTGHVKARKMPAWVKR